MVSRNILSKLFHFFVIILFICGLGGLLGCSGGSSGLVGIGNQANGGGQSGGVNQESNSGGILGSSPPSTSMGDCIDGDKKIDCSQVKLGPLPKVKSVEKSYNAVLNNGSFQGFEIFCYEGKPSMGEKIPSIPTSWGKMSGEILEDIMTLYEDGTMSGTVGAPSEDVNFSFINLGKIQKINMQSCTAQDFKNEMGEDLKSILSNKAIASQVLKINGTSQGQYAEFTMDLNPQNEDMILILRNHADQAAGSSSLTGSQLFDDVNGLVQNSDWMGLFRVSRSDLNIQGLPSVAKNALSHENN